ncbi:MAG: response regulator [Myxococcales bacterium]|nr:response regulator [Myxococcales bacterium]
MNESLRSRFLPRLVEVGGQRCARALAAIMAAEPGAAAAARAELHTLAGETGILGLTELAELAQRGERDCAAWADAGEVAARARAAIAVRTLAARLRALAPVAPPRRVVVVDDSPLVAAEVGDRLRADGWEVEAADDLESTLRLVRDWHPQVVLMDVNMPGLTLADLCARTRAAATGALAICLLSGASDAELTAHARAVGADGWVSKVAGLGVVVERVRAMAGRA